MLFHMNIFTSLDCIINFTISHFGVVVFQLYMHSLLINILHRFAKYPSALTKCVYRTNKISETRATAQIRKLPRNYRYIVYC